LVDGEGARQAPLRRDVGSRGLVNHYLDVGTNAPPAYAGGAVGSGGAKGQTRTADRTIFSRELYQLSYLGGAATTVDQRSLGRWAIEGSNL
jgi:hypothetical protein